ncbi:hypothetical protein MPSEU_001106500 [Mayamaea pseudoterrestris]|nr:hypothetical protein MPSEU_001106500 [Mayamaea pseudoterrestris]
MSEPKENPSSGMSESLEKPSERKAACKDDLADSANNATEESNRLASLSTASNIDAPLADGSKQDKNEYTNSSTVTLKDCITNYRMDVTAALNDVASNRGNAKQSRASHASLAAAIAATNLLLDEQHQQPSHVHIQPGACRVYPSNYTQPSGSAEPSVDFDYDEALVHAGVPTENTEHDDPVLFGMVVDVNESAPMEAYPTINATPVQGFYVKRRRCIWLCCGLLLALIAIGVTAGLLAPNNNNSKAFKVVPYKLPPTIARLAASLPRDTIVTLQSELPVSIRRDVNWYKSSLWASDSFQPKTPQGMAWKWLIADPQSQSLNDVSIRYGLASFYFATNGSHWYNHTHWLSTKHVCHWYMDDFVPYESVKYDSAAENCLSRGFYQLSLLNNNLVGTIPNEFAMVSNLHLLRLGDNALTGTISDKVWASWATVQGLQLQGNFLSGTISSAIGLLTNANMLWLHANRFSGSLPTEMQHLIQLWEFVADDNERLSGSLPSQLGRMSNVKKFSVANNDLTGTIPTELFQLKDLRVLGLGSNQLSGSLPTEIGFCSQFQYLQLSRNNMTGSLPSELGRLTTVSVLFLDNNKFEGTLSTMLGRLTSLDILDVSGTTISGAIPSELSQLPQLNSLRVFDTRLSGSVPEGVCRSFSLQRANDGIVIDCDQVRCDCNCTCGSDL